MPTAAPEGLPVRAVEASGSRSTRNDAKDAEARSGLKVSLEQRAEIGKLAESGIGHRAIAAQMGLPVSSVSYWAAPKRREHTKEMTTDGGGFRRELVGGNNGSGAGA
jgi:hypothetical protein